MNDIELAKLFVEYSETKAKLQELAMYIETAVLEKRETVKLAGVTASYYKPSSGTPRYEDAVVNYINAHPEEKEAVKQFQNVTVTVAWKDACNFFSLEPEPGEEKPARVVIK